MTAEALLRVGGLRLVREDGAALVDGIDLDVQPGESLGIVGESGSGKSLTLRAVMGILPPSIGATGTITRRGRAAMVFQEPATALNPTLRVGRFVALTWRLHHPGRPAGAARSAAVELFEQVGIDRPGDRLKAWPHELSGGMRQRVMIAAALAAEPDLLLCDEPTTALDVRVQAQILTLLRRLLSDRPGTGMVFVSHDLAVVASVCDRLVVMRHGRVVETGTVTEIIERPSEEYTTELLQANLSRRIAASARPAVSRRIGITPSSAGPASRPREVE